MRLYEREAFDCVASVEAATGTAWS